MTLKFLELLSQIPNPRRAQGKKWQLILVNPRRKVLDAFVQALAFYDGVPRRVIIDNPKTMVTYVSRSKERIFHPRFLALMNHYVMEPVPRIEAFELWLTGQSARVSGKSPLGEALRYIARYWQGLILFTSDGRIEIDNNAVERTMRPIALNRKNALFAGHDTGAENWGIISSLIETAKLNNIEPQHPRFKRGE